MGNNPTYRNVPSEHLKPNADDEQPVGPSNADDVNKVSRYLDGTNNNDSPGKNSKFLLLFNLSLCNPV